MRVTVHAEQRSPSPANAERGTDSPFLSEEMFAGETDQGVEARVATLERESPFSHAPGGPEESRSLEGIEKVLGEEELGYEIEEAAPAADSESLRSLVEPPHFIQETVEEALSKKEWKRALSLAIQGGERDYGKLTNLILFAQHDDLKGRRLDPKNPTDRKLVEQWNNILRKEVWSAVQTESTDPDLRVPGRYVAERDLDFWGPVGKKFKQVVEKAATEVGLNSGLLAAVLLAETHRFVYLTPGEVSSFVIGTDDFFARRTQLHANVPAFSKVRFDRTKTSTDVNEHGRKVTTVQFKSGQDAVLATAVYLKYFEVVLRKAAKKLGKDFDALPVETRFALVRIAMAAGPGITQDGDLATNKKGEFLGAGARLDRVLTGTEILVREDLPRQDATTSGKQTNRNATILAAQAIHLSEWVFGQSLKPATPATRPEKEEFDNLEGEEFKPARDESVENRHFASTLTQSKPELGHATEKEGEREIRPEALEGLGSERLNEMEDDFPEKEAPAEEFEREGLRSSHSFQDCDKGQTDAIKRAAAGALKAVKPALAAVGNAIGQPEKMSSNTRRLLIRHFHTTKREHLRSIHYRFRRIKEALEGGIDFQCERKCDVTSKGYPKCGYANTTQLFGGWGDVHICFDARPNRCHFVRDLTPPQQEAMIIHEVAHRYVGINDKAYYIETAQYEKLSAKDATDNADSYAFFAVAMSLPELLPLEEELKPARDESVQETYRGEYAASEESVGADQYDIKTTMDDKDLEVEPLGETKDDAEI
jgi:Lysine-specific metallo-endopeptidase